MTPGVALACCVDAAIGRLVVRAEIACHGVDRGGCARVFRAESTRHAQAKARAYRECYGPDGRDRKWRGK